MSSITRLVVRAREYGRGQTMAEYALILAAVAVVVFVGYQTMGTTITTLLGSVDTSLEQDGLTGRRQWSLSGDCDSVPAENSLRRDTTTLGGEVNAPPDESLLANKKSARSDYGRVRTDTRNDRCSSCCPRPDCGHEHHGINHRRD